MGQCADLIIKLSGEGKSLAEIVTAVAALEDGKRRTGLRGFDAFWSLYPAKIGKGAAEKAYEKALRLATAEVLIDGVQRYAAKRDDRPWCNPATWLNQRRWEDEEPQLQLPAPRSGLARVRATLEREISDGRLSRDQGAGGYVHGGLPLLAQRN